jgi:hypothetical protein
MISLGKRGWLVTSMLCYAILLIVCSTHMNIQMLLLNGDDKSNPGIDLIRQPNVLNCRK